jgi:hypothetical protein
MIKKTLWIMLSVLGTAFEAAAAEQLSIYPPEMTADAENLLT